MYIENFSFVPSPMIVTNGTTVTWINHDAVPHTVTSDATTGPDSFNSGTMSQGSSFSHTFTTLGDHSYYCMIHAGMASMHSNVTVA